MAGSPKKRAREAKAKAEELGIEYVPTPIEKTWKHGKTIKLVVQHLDYETPPVPPHEKIRGHHLPKHDQVWYRDTTYEQWDWNTDPKAGVLWHQAPQRGQMEWFIEEIYKLHNGEWVYINGFPTYFNKYCYFFHQWFILQEGIYPIYKDTSLEYFTFYKLCEDDDFTLGDCGIKGRRVGLSSMSASITLLISLTEENSLQGIVSKTGTDAKEMYLMVKNGLEKLPEFLVPELAKVAETEFHIAKPKARISANNRTVSSDKGKNNRVNWLPTAENAYDGRRARKITIDEGAKWEEADVQICFSKISKTLVVGASCIGHVSLFSSVNKGDKGGDNFKKIWLSSNQQGKLSSIGQTPSRLKRFFLEGYRGFYGYIDKYGNSVIENPTPEQTAYLEDVRDPTTGKRACPNPRVGAKDYLQEQRNILVNDPELLSEEIRQFPFEWIEVFRGVNNLCHFNLEDLTNQIERIETSLEGTGLTENGRRGRFKKRDNGEVYFDDSNTGMWYILEFVENHNKSTYQGSIKCPDNTTFGSAGLDPFANARQTVDKGSDACCIIHKRYDSLDPENSDYPCAMFLGRPDTKQEFFNQVYWGLEYYGIRMLGERAPTDWIDYAMHPNNRLASPETAPKLYGYLIPTKRANNSEVYGNAPQDKEAREQHLTEMVEYSQNNMHKIKFLRLLKNMMGFNINDRTDYDACMAWGYALMGLKSDFRKKIIEPKIINFMQVKKSKKYY
jgi:hypothetical protein